jgi:hypothetical protein
LPLATSARQSIARQPALGGRLLAASSNRWTTKTVEKLPDGNQNIVTASAYGDAMLDVYHQSKPLRRVAVLSDGQVLRRR